MREPNEGNPPPFIKSNEYDWPWTSEHEHRPIKIRPIEELESEFFRGGHFDRLIKKIIDNPIKL